MNIPSYDSGLIVDGRHVPTTIIMERARRAAAGFVHSGIGEGDRVAILLRNDVTLFEASYAAAMTGVSPVPINWHGTPEDVRYILEDSRARVLVVHSSLLDPIRAHLPAGLVVLTVPDRPGAIRAKGDIDQEPSEPTEYPEEMDWSEWLSGFSPLEATPDLSVPPMFYTSGTTGRPKGVRRLRSKPVDAPAGPPSTPVPTHGNRAPTYEQGMRTVIVAPMYHAAPNWYALYSLQLDGLLVLPQRFEPEELLDQIERYQITHLSVVPTMFVRLLRLPDEVRESHDVSSLRHVVHTAAPCPPDVKIRMIDWWGPVINEMYGATEVGPVTYASCEDWLSHPGTVGRALDGATVRILDDEGNDLPQGEVGEIYMRNSALPDFDYEGNSLARREVEREGLITCGDMGYLDDDGFLFLADRKRDMIISGGVNIYSAEIEACLHAHPAVADCAVFGAPDEEFGEAVVAAVQVQDGMLLSEADVMGWVRSNLAAYKTPKIVTFHDELPREDSGKIFKRRLRDPYWEPATVMPENMEP